MEDQGEGPNNGNGKGNGEAVRSRWTPKPEQILILESIFNSGMVNPPKDETVRIRKLLEKFGPVGDANVFYWFQNRRSRSRRRQRQMQAATLNNQQQQQQQVVQQPQPQHNINNMYDSAANTAPFINHNHNNMNMNVAAPAAAVVAPVPTNNTPTSFGHIGSSSYGLDDFSLSAQLGFPEIMDHNSIFCPSTNLHYQSPGGVGGVGGYVTVVINGVATEVPRGPLDLKAMFGEDVMLVHSSGLPLPINEFGFLLQSLQHGESYFLVSRQT